MEYNERDIRALLELYLDGATDLAQERLLREYFSEADDIPSDLLYAKAMFGFFTAAAEDTCAREISGGCSSAMPQSQVNGASLEEKPSAVTRRLLMRRIVRTASVAAAVMVVCGVAFTLIRENRPTVYCYVNGEPVTDPEAAMRQAQMAGRIMEGTMRVPEETLSAVREIGRPLKEVEHVSESVGLIRNN